MKKNITITLSPEKVTKNCVKFAEKPASEFVPEKIGEIYVPKATLAGLGYNGGDICIEIGIGCDIKLMPEKATKNTYKFNEETVSEFAPEKIGSLYVPKSTLAELDYHGDALYVTIKLAK